MPFFIVVGGAAFIFLQPWISMWIGIGFVAFIVLIMKMTKKNEEILEELDRWGS